VNAETKTLISRLNQIRLDGDLSYAALADRVGIDPGGLYKILNDRSARPYDRTLHKIRRYLDAPAAEQPAKPSRKAKGRAA
jgi:transcriptional regulator with XRE-family HTH domain